MSQSPPTLTVLGLDLGLKPSADMDRVHQVVQLVEERFAALKSQRGSNKEFLLTLLVLGLAADVLQLKNELGEVEERVSSLLAQIEKSGNP